MPKTSVIVPCYNEEDVLPKLFERLGAVAGSWGGEYEIICVNDGSQGRSIVLNLPSSSWANHFHLSPLT
jgi:dolichol-phosphate mannosyltransferase